MKTIGSYHIQTTETTPLSQFKMSEFKFEMKMGCKFNVYKLEVNGNNLFSMPNM